MGDDSFRIVIERFLASNGGAIEKADAFFAAIEQVAKVGSANDGHVRTGHP